MTALDMATYAVFCLHRRQCCRHRCRRECLKARAQASASTPSRWIPIHLPSDIGLMLPSLPARAASMPAIAARRATRSSPNSCRALDGVLLDLALQAAKDGGGAQKLIQIDVTGAQSARGRQAHRAFHRQFAVGQARRSAGHDANWGQGIASRRRGRAARRPTATSLGKIAFGGHAVADKGTRAATLTKPRRPRPLRARRAHRRAGYRTGQGPRRVAWTLAI